MSVNEPVYNFARAFADLGTLSMSWSTTKSGSKGIIGGTQNLVQQLIRGLIVSHKAPR